MAQIIVVGFVVNLDMIGRPNMAQVRIPSLHGIPVDVFSSIFNTSMNIEVSKKLNKYCNYDNDKSTNMLTIDSDLPWYYICYPYGSNIGPKQGDIVYVILENTDSLDGLIIGWTGSQIVPQGTGLANIDSDSQSQASREAMLAYFKGANSLQNI